MLNKQWVRVAIGLSAVALVAAACGSSGKGGHPNGGGTPTNAANVFNAGITGVRHPSSVKGGTLNIGITSDCDYWDPARTYYAFCWDLQRFISRGLLMYPAVPGPAGVKPIPDLATSLGQHNANDTVWTYHIRPGLKMSDGHVITTADIKYAIERVFAQTVINGGPAYVIQFLCPVKNAATCPYAGPYANKSAGGLSTITTPDPNTIVFHLNQPFADWDYIMTLPDSTPVEAAKDTGAKYTFKPLSDGPYMFGSYKPNTSLTLVRNPNWVASSDPNRKALPDTINMTMTLSPVAEDNEILTGQIDVAAEGTGVQAATQSRILLNPSIKAGADNPVTGFTRYIAISDKVPPLDNINCRIAVEYAANKVDLQTARGGPVGGGQIATTLAPPSLLGYQSFDLYPDNNGQGDLNMAKQYLAKCGHPNGFTTHIATTNKGKGPLVAEALQAGLARAGIHTIIDEVDAATYYSSFIGSPASVHSKGLGLMNAGWGPDFPTPYGFFDQITCGCAIKQAGNSNYQETNDPTVNSLLNQVTLATSADAEAALTPQIDKAVMATATVLPFVYDKALDITSSRLKNVYIQQAFGIYDFQAMGVM